MPLADRQNYAAIASKTYGGQQCPFCETDLPLQQLVQETQLAPNVVKADLLQLVVVALKAVVG